MSAEGFEIAKAFVTVTADDTGLREQLAAKIKEAAAGEEIKVGVKADDEGVRTGVAKTIAEAQAEADAKKVNLRAAFDENEILAMSEEEFDQLFNRLKETANTGGQQVGDEFSQSLGRRIVNMDDVNAFTQRFSAGVQEVKTAAEEAAPAAEELGASLDNAGRGADDAGGKIRGAGDSARNAGSAAAGSSGMFSGLSGGMMAAVAAAVTLGPALAALPALLGGLGLGGIVAFGALKDVVGALTAANQTAAATGPTAAQAAQTAFSNAVQLAQAEQQLQQAEQSEQYAQEALTQARAQAANQLIDLNNAAADASLSVQGAQLGVAQAQQNYNAVMANSLSTDLQKQQAAYQLAQAQQQLVDAQQRAAEATQAANTANKEGVNGLPSVVQAQRAQEAAAQQVANAQQNLKNIIEQQRLAAAAAASQGASGMNAYQQAMAKLTPVGQEVVKFLQQMNTGFSAAAQNSFLPGVLTFLRDVQPILPQFATLIADAGRALGGIAAQLGGLFKDPTFVSAFFGVLQQGVGLISQIGGGAVGMFQGLTEAAVAAAPIVSAIGGAISQLMSAGLPEFLQGLTVNAGGAGQTISALIGFASDLLGPIGTLIGTISGALGPALTILRPVFTNLVNELLPLALKIINALAPVVTALAQAFGDAFTASLNALMPSLTQLVDVVVQLLPSLIPLIPTFAKLLVAAAPLTNLFLTMTATVLGELIPALTPLIGWLVRLVDAIVTKVIPAVQWLSDETTKQMAVFKQAFDDAVNWVKAHWDGFVSWLEGIPGRVGRALSGMWDGITWAFREAINTVIGWWDNLSFTLPDVKVAGVTIFPGGTIGMPQIPYLADGGTATRAGFAKVGERGEEAVFLPAGAEVQPLAHRGQTLGAGAGVHIENFTFHADIQAMADFSNPNAMNASARRYAIQIRDALNQVQAAYS
jgi:hypothetical protein